LNKKADTMGKFLFCKSGQIAAQHGNNVRKPTGEYYKADKMAWAWEPNELPTETGTFVINVSRSRALDGSFETSMKDSAPCRPLQFLGRALEDGNDLVKLLLPVQSGYIVQSDFLDRRMVDCFHVIDVKGFVTPGQRIEACAVEVYNSMSLSDLLPYCYGAVKVRQNASSSATDKSVAVNKELVNRLSYPWLLPGPVGRKRLALVGGGSLLKSGGYLIAAASLNVDLVVFDESTHWLRSEHHAHYREEFVPLNMTTDANLTQRIVTALAEYQSNHKNGTGLDGVFTADEHLLTIIAHVAEQLGFNTSPAKSVAMAQNKFQTRQLDTNVYCRLLSSPADLEKLLAEDGPRLQYPLIVKPSKGWSSEAIWKVSNEQELRQRVPMLWQDGIVAWHGRGVVVETFVHGPEVDANMVLIDGQVVFFEANDDFPSTGDLLDNQKLDCKDEDPASAPVANFVETSNVLPSALPPSELMALEQRLHELALSAGFRTGVLHMEARLRNSACHYAEAADEFSTSGCLVDLVPNSSASSTTRPEDVFLIEINPRAPGFQACEATAHAYGVSYYSLSILRACSDTNRIKALSQPFLSGPQYHLRMELIAAEKGGVYKSGDVCAAVLHQAPHLKEHVVKCASLMEHGQEVPDPRTGMVYGNFIAYFLVISRTDRRKAIRIGSELRRLVREYTHGF
jgi:hypothetical protein